MKNLMVLPFLVLIVACTAPVQESTETEPPVDAATLARYIEVQTALAADDLEAAKVALEPLAGLEGRLGELAADAASAEDFVGVRKAFFSLSEYLIDSGRVPEGYIVAHCPMAMDGHGANWVQREGEIRNPYFGAVMLNCGAPVDTK